MDIIVGGWYIGKSLIAWTQQRNVLRIEAYPGSQMATATIDVTAGVGLADEITVSFGISFENGTVQYVDVTDVFRSVFDRTKKTLIADTSTPGRIMFQAYNSNGVAIGKGGSYESDLIYYDAVVQAVPAGTCMPISDGWLLPDTFRIPARLPCNPMRIQACTRMTRGATNLDVVNSSGVAIDSANVSQPNQKTYGFGFNPLNSPAFVNLYSGSSGIIEKARVVMESCIYDKILLTWWSPDFGGWKSCLADILGYGDDVSESERYIIGWDYGESKGGMYGLRVRIPNCTPRDYAYYRDIYYSSYVQVFDMALWAENQSALNIEKEVMVEGTPPDAKLNGYVDLEMTLKTVEVSSIW